MAHHLAPLAHLVRVREVSTGKEQDVPPVDARERVNHPSNAWIYVTADSPPVIAPPSTPTTTEPLDARAILEEKSYPEIQALAKAAGLNAGGKKADLIDAILPHVASGTVSLDPVKGFPAPLLQGQFASVT